MENRNNEMTKLQMEKNERTRDKRIQILLAEYRETQLSAQHHDTLVWTVTSIIWAANVILFGTALTAINLNCLPIVLSFLGICLCLSVCAFARQFNGIMGQKYSRCKEIERRLGMTQHTDLEYTPGKQKKIYNFIMSIFIALWVGIILYKIKGLLVLIISPIIYR